MTDVATIANVSTGYNWPAIIAGIASVGSALSIAFGDPALGAVISDPNTATLATAIVGGVSGLISAFSKPVHALVSHVSTVTTPS